MLLILNSDTTRKLLIQTARKLAFSQRGELCYFLVGFEKNGRNKLSKWLNPVNARVFPAHDVEHKTGTHISLWTFLMSLNSFRVEFTAKCVLPRDIQLSTRTEIFVFGLRCGATLGAAAAYTAEADERYCKYAYWSKAASSRSSVAITHTFISLLVSVREGSRCIVFHQHVNIDSPFLLRENSAEDKERKPLVYKYFLFSTQKLCAYFKMNPPFKYWSCRLFALLVGLLSQN